MTKLSEYVGHTLIGRALMGDHAHVVTMKVTEATGDAVKVETENDEEICSQIFETTGWVYPIFADMLEFGETPFSGNVENTDYELELDFEK